MIDPFCAYPMSGGVIVADLSSTVNDHSWPHRQEKTDFQEK
jgi:hypothetical protein